MGLAILAGACKKDLNKDEKPLIPVPGIILDTLVGEISVNTIVTEDVYLHGLVYVKPGVTLTINPGLTVYGSLNTNGGLFDSVNLFKNKGTLCVERGARLIAQGTCTSPIIWTSDDKIPNGSRKVGDWGGVVLYGNGIIHTRTGGSTNRYEAFDIVPNDTRNFYGGTNANDNSGTMTYNRIEFAGGVVTAPNKEVNGLTLCAVGAGTTIHHIEVLKSGDDAFEFFGGSVNMHHLLSYANKDDDFDFDEGYNGNMQFLVGVRDTSADNSGSHLIETDNDGSASQFTPYTVPFIANATLIGNTVRKNRNDNPNSFFEGVVKSRRSTSLRLVNSYLIANAMDYNLIFTPTTGEPTTFSPLLDPPSLALPGNVQAFNIYQINNPGFAGAAVWAPSEGDPTALGLVNNAAIVARLSSAANGNNGLNSQSDFNLGPCLENTSSTPFLNTGTDLAALGLPFFVGTTERGGVITSDNWTCAGVSCGWISIDTN